MTLDPCRPRSPLSCCSSCDRLAEHLPHNPEQRPRSVLMDVTAILREGQQCPMFVAKLAPRDWWLADMGPGADNHPVTGAPRAHAHLPAGVA